MSDSGEKAKDVATSAAMGCGAFGCVGGLLLLQLSPLILLVLAVLALAKYVIT